MIKVNLIQTWFNWNMFRSVDGVSAERNSIAPPKKKNSQAIPWSRVRSPHERQGSAWPSPNITKLHQEATLIVKHWSSPKYDGDHWPPILWDFKNSIARPSRYPWNAALYLIFLIFLDHFWGVFGALTGTIHSGACRICRVSHLLGQKPQHRLGCKAVSHGWDGLQSWRKPSINGEPRRNDGNT